MDVSSVFRTNLKAMREAQGMSQGALAKEIGVSPQTVKNWEQGRAYPTFPKIGDLATALKCLPESLFACVAAPQSDSVRVAHHRVLEAIEKLELVKHALEDLGRETGVDLSDVQLSPD